MSSSSNPFELHVPVSSEALQLKPILEQDKLNVHVSRGNRICDTDSRGHATPGGKSPRELVLHASDGFIPLWARDSILRWRFQERSMQLFVNPQAAKTAIHALFTQAVGAWGDAVPVRFEMNNDSWDFEIAMRSADECSEGGCVLASAFFPDSGRHRVELYPRMFTQSVGEQLETLVHEIGHIFGLRHFFADIQETEWRSETFGRHEPFTIMNYGSESVLTELDKADLKRLYQLARSGELTNINGTPIRLVKPFHTLGGL